MTLKVKKTDLIIYITLIAYLEPALFIEFSVLDNIYLVFKILASLYVVWWVFLSGNRLFSTQGQIACIAFFASMVVTTIINNGNAITAVRTVGFNALSCIYIIWLLKIYGQRACNIFANISLLYMTINAVLLVFFNDGFGKYISGYSMTVDSRLNFLGKDNALIHFFLFAIVVVMLNTGRHNKIKKIYAICVMLGTMLYTWSGTGLVGCILILAYIVLIQGKKIDRIFDYRILFGVNVAAFFGIVVFRIQNIFSFLIVDILGKDITFTGRTSLWDTAIVYILEKPFIGYGITEKFIVAASGIAYSPHDLILQILLAGGFLSLICFLIFYFICVSRLKYQKFKSANLIAFSICVYLLVSLTESTMNTQFLYWLLALAYCINCLDDGGTAII